MSLVVFEELEAKQTRELSQFDENFSQNRNLSDAKVRIPSTLIKQIPQSRNGS